MDTSWQSGFSVPGGSQAGSEPPPPPGSICMESREELPALPATLQNQLFPKPLLGLGFLGMWQKHP